MYVSEEAQGHPDRPNGVIYSPNWSRYQTYDGLFAGTINYSVIIKCFLSEDSKYKINISVLWERKCSFSYSITVQSKSNNLLKNDKSVINSSSCCFKLIYDLRRLIRAAFYYAYMGLFCCIWSLAAHCVLLFQCEEHSAQVSHCVFYWRWKSYRFRMILEWVNDDIFHSWMNWSL